MFISEAFSFGLPTGEALQLWNSSFHPRMMIQVSNLSIFTCKIDSLSYLANSHDDVLSS